MVLRFSGRSCTSPTESGVHDHLPTHLATADRPEVSANSSCRRPTVCAVGDPPEPGFLFVDRGLGGSRFVLLAGRRRAGVVNRGRGILLSSAVAEYAGRHGCVSLGQGQPHR